MYYERYADFGTKLEYLPATDEQPKDIFHDPFELIGVPKVPTPPPEEEEVTNKVPSERSFQESIIE